MNQRVVISGCSGGGKSTLLEELARRGFQVMEEPGRRVIHHEIRDQGTAFPWTDLPAFLQRATELAEQDYRAVEEAKDWVFFDRGLIDAAVAWEHLSGEPHLAALKQSQRYHPQVFLTPPWPEIYVQDPERRHGFDDALAEYSRLLSAYPRLGYKVLLIPKTNVEQRADFILQKLTQPSI